MPLADVARRSAEIGYWLGEANWGKGIMTDALRAVSKYVFTSFDVCRIQTIVFESNQASIRVLDKAGYAFEGRQRKADQRFQAVPPVQFILWPNI